MLKNKLMALSAVLFFLTACGQKADPAGQASEATKEETQKIQDSARQVSKDIPQKTQESAEKISNDAAKPGIAGKEGAKKSAVVMKETAEQALAETAGHAREITKTQKSESRQRGQMAEDEMMMEMDKRK